MKVGFLMNDVTFRVNKDDFIDSHHNNIYISRSDRHQTVEAYEASLNYNTSDLISTLGEFFEREILINSNPLQKKTLLATSLYNGESKKIASNKVIFSGEFIDSCGMSSHTLSNKTITNSFFEFFERQSYLLNYLSKSQGVIVNISNEVSLVKYDAYLKQFVDEIKYYDISLDSDLHVILAVCTGETFKAVGLGTSVCMYQGVLKSQKEALQYFAVSITKHNNLGVGYSTSSNMDRDLYHSNFDSLSSSELSSNYSYLNKNAATIMVNRSNDKKLELANLINRLYQKYKIHPYITSLSSHRDIPNLKITKVYDENWFPHMNPKLYPSSMYDFIEDSTGLSLDRSVEVIPFP
ncbi:hypothetical protein FC756_24550 [Lysinibacillus mangiferihumi]|uniref:YcaO domain-containing protein n=1 Tax=Lysinibacillus mangiferihumi TaxID=1130819 RepID=A0A4U2XZ87_9BACI|nr:YcaO-like family protein [Lysinibacillus mangiferihumi]TKI53328.1 hypothetical protein FC756_24550 [Lysinibacillus mangiferihumi]